LSSSEFLTIDSSWGFTADSIEEACIPSARFVRENPVKKWGNGKR